MSLKIESLWILTNLSLVDGFNQRLFRDHNIQELIQGLILEHFVDGQQANPNKESRLAESELVLLENMLWLTGNLAVDVGYELQSGRLAEQLFEIACNHSAQLRLSHWQRIIWNLRMLSASLRHFEDKDVSAYINFLIRFGGVICESMTRK